MGIATLIFECRAEWCAEQISYTGTSDQLEAAAETAGWEHHAGCGWLCPKHAAAYQDYLSRPAR